MAFLGGFNSGFASGAQLGLGIRDQKDRKARQAVLDERYKAGIDRQDARTKVLDERYQRIDLRQEAAANRQKELAGQQKTAFTDSQKELKYKLAERASQKRIKDAADLAAIIQDTGDYSPMFQTPKGQEYMQQFGVTDANVVSNKGDFFIHAINDKGQPVVFNPATQGFTLGDSEDGIKPMHANGIKAIGAHFMGLQGNEAMTVDAMLSKRHIALAAQKAKEARGIAGKVMVAEAKSKPASYSSMSRLRKEIGEKKGLKKALSDKLNGEDLPEAAMSYAKRRIDELASNNMQAEAIRSTILGELNARLTFVGGTFNDTVKWNDKVKAVTPASKGAAAIEAYLAGNTGKQPAPKQTAKAVKGIAAQAAVPKKPIRKPLTKRQIANDAIVRGNTLQLYADNIDTGTMSNGWADEITVSKRVNSDKFLSSKDKRAIIYYLYNSRWPDGMKPKTGQVSY